MALHTHSLCTPSAPPCPTIHTHLLTLSREHTLLTPAECAKILGVTSQWVRELINSGELRAVNVGASGRSTRWRVDPEDLIALMRSRESRARDLIAG